jgi:hypothetical protein
MKKIGNMLCLVYFKSNVFAVPDEKRNVKQPPHLLVIKNLTLRFYNLIIPIPAMS